mmetsp:Transcript_145527/g.466405  ORF Transcript_145527/g.466405 Transcript_145527/m.466405 type:complete len:132 (+) Transcript_145527:57-452(+)
MRIPMYKGYSQDTAKASEVHGHQASTSMVLRLYYERRHTVNYRVLLPHLVFYCQKAKPSTVRGTAMLRIRSLLTNQDLSAPALEPKLLKAMGNGMLSSIFHKTLQSWSRSSSASTAEWRSEAAWSGVEKWK